MWSLMRTSLVLAVSLFPYFTAADITNSMDITTAVTTNTTCPIAQECAATYVPVCATNGVTYVNRCQLDAAHCRNATVIAAYNGKCYKKKQTRPVIMLVGDSITRRSFDPTLQGWGVRLAYDYSPALDVINRGMGGYTTKWMLQFGMNDLLTALDKYEPSLLTFWLGTNDGAVNKTHSVTLEQYRFYYLQLLKMIQKQVPKCKILLVAPPPVQDEAWSASIKEHGAVVLDIAKSQNLDVVDLYAAFDAAFPTPANRTNVWVDGVHLTAVGNNEAYKNIKAKITTMMPASFFTTLQEPIPEEATLIA